MKVFTRKSRIELGWFSQILTRGENLILRLSAHQSSAGLEESLLNESMIVFGTLSVMGRKSCQEMNSVKNIIIDEAGQAVEPEVLIPFPLLEETGKLLLVGDPQQLPATVLSPEAERLGFKRSMMERLMAGGMDYSLLNIQYRMHSEISVFPSTKYYGGKLINAAPVEPRYQALPPFIAPYSFIHVEGTEERGPHGHSFKNILEIRCILMLLSYLHKRHQIDVTTQVAIITFYSEQAELINVQLNHIKEYGELRARTIDGYQGGEADFVIISCVRANPKGHIGFTKDSQRLNREKFFYRQSNRT
jgi:senataxin